MKTDREITLEHLKNLKICIDGFDKYTFPEIWQTALQCAIDILEEKVEEIPVLTSVNCICCTRYEVNPKTAMAYMCPHCGRRAVLSQSRGSERYSVEFEKDWLK